MPAARSSADVTALLRDAASARPGAGDRLFDAVYPELRRIARASPGRERARHTLQPTALVHEAYLALLVGPGPGRRPRALPRRASQAMRRVLVDHARRRVAAKRGGGATLLPLDEALPLGDERRATVLALDDALGKLAPWTRPRRASSSCAYFGGLTLDEWPWSSACPGARSPATGTAGRMYRARARPCAILPVPAARVRARRGAAARGPALPAAARAGCLAPACAGDAALRPELESLLRAAVPGAASSRPPSAWRPRRRVPGVPRPRLAPAVQRSGVGRRIGPYQVTRVIGRGGMGAVYRAVRADDAFRKQVAIKLIRHGADDPSCADASGPSGRSWPPSTTRTSPGSSTAARPTTACPTSSWSIEGPIDRYCDAGALSVAERLRLFLHVCAAVQYAHQNLVVHRDLKPGNILVTADGAPKLLDFGIAKLLDATPGERATATMRQAMTPAYASPEQVRGEPITTASDVYSLGVLLYELLTGQPPYRLDRRTVRDRARDLRAEPEKPSAGCARDGGGQPRAGLTPERLRAAWPATWTPSC